MKHIKIRERPEYVLYTFRADRIRISKCEDNQDE